MAQMRSSLQWLLSRGYYKKGIEDYYGTFYFRDILSVDQFRQYRHEDIHRLVEWDGGKTFKVTRDEHDDIIELTSNRQRQGGEGGGLGRFKGDDQLTRVSKSLSFILRHGAHKMGLKLDSAGFLPVDDLLRMREFQNVTLTEIQQVVETNNKKRFFMDTDPATGRPRIRANQGHTIEVEDLDLKEVVNPEEFPTVVHGTYHDSWKTIQKEGLRPMGRQHIHFAKEEPGEGGVISGMRTDCQIAIHLNLAAAMQDGIRFFVSANGVILSSGNEKGLISPKYFGMVIQRKPQRMILQ